MFAPYEPGQASAYAQGKGWNTRRSGNEVILETCPCCGGGGWKFYVNDLTGLFSCKHGACGQKGNFYQLLKTQGEEPQPLAPVPFAKAARKHTTGDLLSFELALGEDAAALAYLASRGLTPETARAWHLGVKTDDQGIQWLLIPYIVNDVIVDIKYRSLPPAPKRFKRRAGGDSILFGQHTMTGAREQGHDVLYLCEGELDCITLWQNGYWPALSTTTGAQSFKTQWYDQIVAFDPKAIVLCYDSDAAGQKAAEGLMKRFEDRTVTNIVLPDAKDANEYFTKHTRADFDALVTSAKPPEIENAKTMATVLDMLQEQLWFSANSFDGMPSQFKDVNAMIAGGYWNGQLVTISGSSGTGKTSFVLQELLQMSKEGHPAYLLCLEMPEIMMARKIIEKEFGVPMLEINEQHVQKYRAQLESLPFYMGSKSGDLDEVESTIRAAVRRYGLKIVAFDNINYFVRSIEHVTQEIARVTKRMKELAIDLNIPIIQIAQPRKFDEGVRMMRGDDLKDSAAVQQDSDTIILLHRPRIRTEVKDIGKGNAFLGNQSPYCVVRVDKARYSAGGETTLFFNGARSCYRELTTGEREAQIGAAA